MTVKYLLPCSCGRQIVIEPRQAGETISCSCGASLQTPTLLNMTTLELAPPESVREPSSNWGLKHRVRLLGTVLVVSAIFGGVWLFLKRPISPFDTIDPERIRQTAQKFSPLQTWDIWETMKQGLDRRTDQQYAAALLRFRLRQGVVIAVALLGVGLIAAGMVRSKHKGLGISD